MTHEEKNKGYWKIDWGRQGRVTFAYILVFLVYYGIIVNIFMFDRGDDWFSFEILPGTSVTAIPEAVKSMIFWTYEFFLASFLLPCLLLFFVCFWLTYKEDIAHYGIRASIWLVPFIISEGFIFYFIMFGFSAEAFILQFASIKGYLNLLILLGINVCGALSGMFLKRYIKNLREV
jgi:hypothetical protein